MLTLGDFTCCMVMHISDLARLFFTLFDVTCCLMVHVSDTSGITGTRAAGVDER